MATIPGTVTSLDATKKPRSRFTRTAVPAPETSGNESPALAALTSPAPVRAGVPVAMPTTALHPHPANPPHRYDAGFEDLAAQIKAQGLLEPLRVRPAPGGPAGTYEVLSGARRLAAAQLLGLLMVDVVIDDVDDATALRTVLAANLGRQDFTEAEESVLVQGLLDLGWSEQMLAEQVGRGSGWVARRRAVAQLPAAARAVVDAVGGMEDLTQAAAIAEFADDPEVHADLVRTARAEPDQVRHRLERARQDRTRRQLRAAKVAELLAADPDLVILDERPTGTYDARSEVKSLSELSDKPGGKDLDPKAHRATCPGHAVHVGVGYAAGTVEGFRAYTEAYCTTWRTAGHFNRHATNSSGATSGPMDDKAKAARKHLIETNKAAEAARVVRLAWLREFFARPKLPADALPWTAGVISATPSWISFDNAAAFELTHPGKDQTGPADRAAWLQSPAGATKHLVALAVWLVEVTWVKDYWRPDGYQAGGDRWAPYLAQLGAWGYALAPHEQDLVDAHAKKAKAKAGAKGGRS